MSAMPPTQLEALLQHADWVRDLARHLVRDSHAAEDLAQSAWVAALEHPPDEARPAKRWFAKILRNLAIDRGRADARRHERERRVAREESQLSADELAHRLATHRALVDAVAALEEPQRSAVLLRYFEGLPPREVARRQGVPVATARTRLARALDRLRAELDRRHGGRRTWAAALAPLAAPWPALPWAAVGVAAMNGKLAIGLLAIACAVGAWMVFTNETNRGVGPSDRPTEVAPMAKAAAPAAAAGPARASAESAPVESHKSDAASSPAPAKLAGRVLDAESRAVAGAELLFFGSRSAGEGPPPSPTILGESDSDGNFAFAHPLARGNVAVRSERWVTILSAEVDERPSDFPSIVVVAPRIELAGIVVDGQKEPIEGARVSIADIGGIRTSIRAILDSSREESFVTTTDRDGHFEIRNAPVIPRAWIFAEKESGYGAGVAPEPSQSKFDLVLTLFAWSQKSSTLCGRVLLASGDPAPKAHISAGGMGATADAEGRFELQMGNKSTAEVVAALKGSLPARLRVEASIVGDHRAWPQDVTLRLGGEALEIVGVVVRLGDRPIPKANVWIDDPTRFGSVRMDFRSQSGPQLLENVLGGRTGMPVFWADAEGRFKIVGLERRNYRVRALDPATLAVSPPLEIEAGGGEVTITIPESQLYDRVAGQVVERDGKPVAGVWIGAARETYVGEGIRGIGAVPPVLTGADGRFEFRRVAREGLYLALHGEKISPRDYKGPFGENPNDLRIVVPLRCHFQIELADPNEAQEFRFFDEKSGRLDVVMMVDGGTAQMERGWFSNGKSQTFSVDETATTLVLYKGDKEVRRVPVTLVRGELTVIRP